MNGSLRFFFPRRCYSHPRSLFSKCIARKVTLITSAQKSPKGSGVERGFCVKTRVGFAVRGACGLVIVPSSSCSVTCVLEVGHPQSHGIELTPGWGSESPVGSGQGERSSQLLLVVLDETPICFLSYLLPENY